MPVDMEQNPWDVIEALVEAGNKEHLGAYLGELTPYEVARAISRLDEEDQSALLTLLEPEDAADLLEELSDMQGADLIEDLPADQAAAIVDEMESDHRVDILNEMDEEDAEAILLEMDPEEAQDARQLLTYDEDAAGGLMVTDFLYYPKEQQVKDVLDDLRRFAEQYADYQVQYVYVASEHDTLVGVIPLRQLVLAPSHTRLEHLMLANPVYAMVNTPQEELEQIFDRYNFNGIPVVDETGRMVGVVHRAWVEEAHSERTEKDFMRFSGIIGGDELRNMPLASRSFGRLSWLTLNMLLNCVAAMVILFFEETIDKVLTLAVALPIICNMSGCSGNQAVAVSIREMALGLIQPRDYVRVMIKEIQVGIINGVALGTMIGAIGWIAEGNLTFGFVVGGALMLNTLIAVTLGGALPLALRKIKVDPAAAAAPVMTTLIDMCGFFFVLGFATWALRSGVLMPD